jgi:hypothetical protein
LTGLNWIQDKGLSVISSSSSFQGLVSDQTPAEDVIAWLCGKVSSPSVLSVFEQDQQRALDDIRQLAQEWKQLSKKEMADEFIKELEKNKTCEADKVFALLL